MSRAAVEAVIHDSAAPLLLGQSAFDPSAIGRISSPSPTSSAMPVPGDPTWSAVDIAIWDLLGQYLGQPIYNLLGGRCRDSIPIYNTCVNTAKYPDQDGFLQRPGELARHYWLKASANEGLAVGSLRSAHRHRSRSRTGRMRAPWGLRAILSRRKTWKPV